LYISVFSLVFCSLICNFAPETSRAVIFGWTRQPSIGSHGGQYDVVVLTSKTFQIMQQHIYYIKAAIKRIQRKLAFFVERKQARPQAKYALRFADMQIQELVTTFNSLVQNRGWSSMRAYHDQALIDEFRRRGINVSVISDGKTISFAHPVKYNIEENRLILIC
jgi:hypothetical protein